MSSKSPKFYIFDSITYFIEHNFCLYTFVYPIQHSFSHLINECLKFAKPSSNNSSSNHSYNNNNKSI